MADPGVSTQNFLRLLLGGAQQGANVMQQRETMKQQQAPDLMMALQQMMQRKQIADVEQNQRQQGIDQAHAAITEDRMYRAGRDYKSDIQTVAENARANTMLDLQKRSAARGEYMDTRAAMEDNLTRINKLRDEADRTRALSKIADQYPQLAPFIDLSMAGEGNSSIDDLIRSFAPKQPGSTVPTQEDVAKLTVEFLRAFSTPGGSMNLPKGVDVYTYAKQKAEESLGIRASSSPYADTSLDDLKKREAELEAEVAANKPKY